MSPRSLPHRFALFSLTACLVTVAGSAGAQATATEEPPQDHDLAQSPLDHTPQSVDDPAAASTEGATMLAPVRVQATVTGAASEGSGSYTAKATTIGKSEQTLREIPQSVSVITRQRLDDQNISSLPDALKYATGVTVQRLDGAGYFNNFHARGYVAETVQLDGINVQYNANMADTDLAVYDRVEIQRGAAGLFQGAGEPGVVVNLARKRALADTQVKGSFSAGSWDAYRTEVDATGALDSNGRLRGRAVLALDDRDSYMDGVFGKKKVGYGTLEYDLLPSTTISVGAIWQKIDSVINQGLPATAEGKLLDLPVSTSIVADWNRLDMDSADYFGEVEHRLAGGGQIKFALRHIDRTRLYDGLRSNGAVAANGDFGVESVYFFTKLDDTAADLYLSLPFTFAGREHDVVAGIDYRSSESGTPPEHALSYSPANSTSNIYNHNPHMPRPALVPGGFGVNRTETEQYGTYVRARLRATERFSVLLGSRLSWWESQSRNQVTGVVSGHYNADAELSPYGALMFDLSKSFSIYASYSDIFKPQNAVTESGEQIDPRTGHQYEVGIKGEFMDGRVNAHAALYRIEDKNRALSVSDAPPYSIAAGKARSEGFEAEISGELLPSWEITAGYAYVTTEFLSAPPAQLGQSISTFTPRHSFNLWTKYAFTEGVLSGLDIGGGVRAVSDFYSGSSFGTSKRFDAPGFAILALQGGYRLNEYWSLAGNVENVLDRKYYEKVSGATRQNFYGAPRSYTLTVRVSF